MDVTKPCGDFLATYPFYDEKKEGESKDISSVVAVKHITSNTVVTHKKVDIFEVKQSSTSEFDSIYQKTSMVESSRLIMTNFNNSMEELNLVRALNLEFEKNESEWTPIEAPAWFSDETIKDLIELNKLEGGFFSRVWVLMDKETKSLIGIMTTSRLTPEGYSVISRHLLKEYTGKGFGSEALLSIFEYYSGFKMQIPKIDRRILKIRIQKVLFNIAENLLPACKVCEFKEYISSGDFSDSNKLYRITRSFQNRVGIKIRNALHHLESPVREERFSAFFSFPSSEAAVRSLEKCGFVKLPKNKYMKYCES